MSDLFPGALFILPYSYPPRPILHSQLGALPALPVFLHLQSTKSRLNYLRISARAATVSGPQRSRQRVSRLPRCPPLRLVSMRLGTGSEGIAMLSRYRPSRYNSYASNSMPQFYPRTAPSARSSLWSSVELIGAMLCSYCLVEVASFHCGTVCWQLKASFV